MKPDIYISIVLYRNGKAQVEKAIRSVLISALNVKLFLVDNSPTDDLRDLQNIDSRIKYIMNPMNAGYGSGHNIAIRTSIENGAKYHLVMNPDVYFKEGVLERLYAYMQSNPKVGHIMPKVLYPDGEIQYLCKLLPTPVDLILRRFIPLKTLQKRRCERYELRFTGYDNIMEVPYLSGCFMFLRVSALEDVGLFDERYFMYPEDVDLTRRIHEKYETIYYPYVHVTHEHKKESYKSMPLLGIHAWNLIKYFNKWGWFIDTKRSQINKRIIDNCNSLQTNNSRSRLCGT